ncbi:hypothetical protein LJB82_04180 [Desulfovibrio sp. OttesenSCG-928-M16]|nr:hypothetical protein [Desulfovibrio sp. OttesenSCG-928-M16]
MKKIAAILVMLALVCGIAVYVAVVPKLKAEREAEVAAFLASLPGEVKAGGITVELLPGNIILRDITGRFVGPDNSSLEFSAPEFTVMGLTQDLPEQGGPVKLAHSIAASGLTLTLAHKFGESDAPGALVREELQVAGFIMRDVVGDGALLLDCLRPDVSLTQRLRAAAGFSAASFQVTGYSKNIMLPLVGQVHFKAKNLTLRDLRLFGIGKGIWEGLSAGIQDKELLSLARISVDGLSLPDFSGPLLELEQNPEVDFKTGILAALEKEPISLSNLELIDLKLDLFSGERLTAKRLYFDVQGALNKTHLRHATEALSIPSGLLAFFGEDGSNFAKVYGKELLLDAQADLSASHTGGKGEIEVTQCALQAADLASLTIEGLLLYEGEGEAEYFDSDLKLALKRGALLLTEKNLVEYALRASMPGSEQLDAQQLEVMRRHLADSVRIDAQNSIGEGGQRILEGLAQLVEKPGSLRVVCAPAEALWFDDADMLNKLKPEVEFVPAAQ